MLFTSGHMAAIQPSRTLGQAHLESLTSLGRKAAKVTMLEIVKVHTTPCVYVVGIAYPTWCNA